MEVIPAAPALFTIVSITCPGSAQKGTSVSIPFTVRNDGGIGRCYIRAVRTDTAAIIATGTSPTNIRRGQTWSDSLSFTMPADAPDDGLPVAVQSSHNNFASIDSTQTCTIGTQVATTITITGPAQVEVGEQVTHSGTLTRNDTAAGVPNETVTLYRRLGAGPDEQVGTSPTDTAGGWTVTSIAPDITGTWAYTVNFPGSPGLQASAAEMGVTVGPKAITAENVVLAAAIIVGAALLIWKVM